MSDTQRYKQIGFQSLFWWRGHLDSNVIAGSQAGQGFQSLFWWRGHLDTAWCRVYANWDKFQSLFWWRGHLDILLVSQPSLTHQVSILVLVERPFGHCNTDLALFILQVSILVLVERPFGLRVAGGHACSRAASVSILVLVERPFGRDVTKWITTKQAGFQSLFWWRGHLDPDPYTPEPAPKEFQSLFWWRGHLDLSPYMQSSAPYCFNPCFGGEAIWTRVRARPVRVKRVVSILVLVERPFGPAWTPAHRAARRCFNPCFGGEAIWTSLSPHYSFWRMEFQSLFWWRGHLDRSRTDGH